MKKLISFFAVFAMIFSLSAAYAENLDDTLNQTAQYVYNVNPEPQFGSVGGEWAIFALSRCGYDVGNSYYSDYYERVKKYIIENNGVLSKTRNTEYSRTVIALTSIGKDCTDIGGYNLLTPLGDYEKTVAQGINGAAWALIALDCGNYNMPQNNSARVQATRDMYVRFILDKALPYGGFSYNGEGEAESDLTAIMIQALSHYMDREDVKTVIYDSILRLSIMQEDSGGFISWGVDSPEGIAQTIVALTSVGVPIDDDAFVKNGNTLLKRLMDFRIDGGFRHSFEESAPNEMTTEQCLYAMSAAERAQNGKNKLYDLSDAKDASLSLKRFSDMENSPYLEAVMNLTAKGIINGRTDTEFVPDGTVTRAEFAAIVVRALNLDENSENIFDDVKNSDWFYPYIGAAYESGIIKGISDTEFNPYGTITREEAAVMVSRAAKYLGKYIYTIGTEEDISEFSDYNDISRWAKDSLIFCYRNGILQKGEKAFPKIPSLRGETAQMLYNMLEMR